MLLTSTVAVCSLVQYPFSFLVYFCYVAPLLVLNILALLNKYSLPPSTLAIVGTFALLFPLLCVRPLMERGGHSHLELVRLGLPRAGGLYVPAGEARDYKEMYRVVRMHASAGSYIYAAPDEPQVYFLTEMRNPTPILYSILDEPRGQADRILETIAAQHVKVVVVGSDVDPLLHAQIQPGLLQQLQTEFPNAAQAGRFQVRWRP